MTLPWSFQSQKIAKTLLNRSSCYDNDDGDGGAGRAEPPGKAVLGRAGLAGRELAVAGPDASSAVILVYRIFILGPRAPSQKYTFEVQHLGRAGQGRAGPGRAGPPWAEPGRAGFVI